VIVHQHNPSEPTLGRMIWRLLGPRLRGADATADPLAFMADGMARLAVRDAEQQLADQLVALAG
jgi:UDP-N-acetylglucosamine--N-acetylmuramyl-(pentapeptide) pyrophosphoryl-undecaprenol N-acetylglucosamine transferase